MDGLVDKKYCGDDLEEMCLVLEGVWESEVGGGKEEGPCKRDGPRIRVGDMWVKSNGDKKETMYLEGKFSRCGMTGMLKN